jgi:hypothetical protein
MRNAGPSFQHHMDRATRNCKVAFAWVDNIVICSRNHEEHVVHVPEVLHALQDKGLLIHAKKCVWGIPELEYLGHKISAAGVLQLPSHVAAIQEFPNPTIIKEPSWEWATSTGDSCLEIVHITYNTQFGGEGVFR